MIMRSLIALLLVATFFGFGCDRMKLDPSKDSKSPDISDTAKDEQLLRNAESSNQTKDDFMKSLHTNLDQLNLEIIKLREKGKVFKDQAKAEWDLVITNLESKRDSLAKKIAEAERSTGDAWEQVQHGVSEAWKDLSHAVQEAAKKL